MAKPTGRRRGGTQTEVRTCTGRTVDKRIKPFVATCPTAGGVIRVILVEEAARSWRALFCTDPQASEKDIVQMALDRWGIE